jgi:hypothetical protein
MNENLISLDTIGQGAAIEMFQTELDKVLTNIIDPNTKATTVRRITLTVDIKPDEDRSFGLVAIATTAKLAPVKAVGTAIYIGQRAGHAVATERDTKQLTFDDNVVTMKEGTNAK